MISFIFIVLLIIMSIYDIKYRIIPNIIVLPGIVLGCILTNNYLWAVLMFAFGAYLYPISWTGGDVKLMSMIGAFAGPYSIPIIMTKFVLVTAYRHYKRVYTPLPGAPFLSSACFIILLVIKATSWSLAVAGYIPAIE